MCIHIPHGVFKLAIRAKFRVYTYSTWCLQTCNSGYYAITSHILTYILIWNEMSQLISYAVKIMEAISFCVLVYLVCLPFVLYSITWKVLFYPFNRKINKIFICMEYLQMIKIWLKIRNSLQVSACDWNNAQSGTRGLTQLLDVAIWP